VTYNSILRRLMEWLVVSSFLGFGLAMAQAEPSMNEIYATAQAGKLDEAQKMITHVLLTHPNSAKAFFVQSELFARQGRLGQARTAMASADRLAPGLPFAKPDAVQALRAQLAAKAPPPAMPYDRQPTRSLDTPGAPSSPSWGLPLLLGVGVIVAGYFMFRRRPPVVAVQSPAYAEPNGLNGPQTFGNTATAQPAAAVQPAGSGLGGRIMGGVATGLAVGAGVMAAEAIGRNLMGGHNQPGMLPENRLSGDYQPSTTNTDMGGQNFGVNDAASWDDAGSSDAGGGGDWDT
jgi:hypothetical protein